MAEDGTYTDLVVSGISEISGDVVGAHVRSGGQLTIMGRLSGRIWIEEGAAVAVTGQLTVSDVENHGALAVKGLLLGTTEHFDAAGNLGIAAGSMVNDKVVDGDGSLMTPGPNMEVKVEQNRLCVWLSAEGRFFGEG